MAAAKGGNSANFLPYLIVSLVAVFLAAMAVTFTAAVRSGSQVVESDYYSRGLNYDRDNLRERNGEKLGWRIVAEVSGGMLEIRVVDALGRPISGGRAVLAHSEKGGKSGDHPRPASGSVVFAEKRPGIYAVPVPMDGNRDLQGRVLFTRGGAAVAERVVIVN